MSAHIKHEVNVRILRTYIHIHASIYVLRLVRLLLLRKHASNEKQCKSYSIPKS